MDLDSDDVLLSDADEAPEVGAFDDLPPAAPAARKRGRPRGSTTASGARRPSRLSGAAGGSGAKSERLAGVAEMSRLLSKLIGGASVLLAFGLVGAEAAESVAMTAQEASAIATPAARLLSKSRWARQAATLAAKSSDAIDLTLALGAYLMRVYPVIALHQAQQATRGAARNVNMGSPQPVRTDARGANAASGSSAGPATGPAASDPTSYGREPAYIAPYLGLSDADANQFAAWGAGDMAAAVRAATGN
jgi:hypothetical protein